MEGGTDLICQNAFRAALGTFWRVTQPREQPQGQQPQGQVRPWGDSITEGRRHALHIYRERTNTVAADASANYEQLLVKTLDDCEIELRHRTQQGALAMEAGGGFSPQSACVGTLGAIIVQGSASAARKAGELAGLYSNGQSPLTSGIGCGLCVALDLSVLAPTLAVIFVASVGVLAIGNLVRNVKRAYSDDNAGGQ